MGLAQVPARKSRPEPEAHGPEVRRYLLFASLRSGYAARGNHGGAGYRGTQRTRAVRGHFLVWTAEDARRGGDAARAGNSVPDPPAVLFDAESLGGGWAAAGAG